MEDDDELKAIEIKNALHKTDFEQVVTVPACKKLRSVSSLDQT